MPSGRQQTPRLRLWLALLLTLAVSGVAAWRLTLSYDLGAFLPPPDTQAQWLLTQRLGQGPGAQLLFIRLSNSSAAEALQLANRIREHPEVRRVLPEPAVLSPAAIPEPLWQHRLLLGDLPTDAAGWQAVLAQRTDDLMFAADDETLQLIAADPALLSIGALTALTAGANQPAFHQGATQYLMVETRAAGFELAAQTALIHDLRGQLAAFEDAALLGSPVYAVDLQSAVRLEATLFSSLAGLALLLLMIVRFRSLHRVIGVALPLAAGGAGGLLALTLAFDAVHGITVAFGFTLLGVAIDYPLHLYTHQEHGGRQSIWPVLRLGIASTLIAYGAFIFSGTPGLQQLGLFAFVGITAAALITAWITAEQHRYAAGGADGGAAQRLRWWPALSALVVAGVVLSGTQVFNDNLSSLTPVDPDLLAADARVRSELGVSDIRYVVSIRGNDEQQTLQATETAVHRLQPLIADGGLDGVQAVTHILPSRRTQAQRRAALGLESHNPFDAALAQLPLAAEAFAPFRAALAAEQTSDAFLTREQLLMDDALNATVSTLFFPDDTQWVSLMFLRGLTAPEGVASALTGMADTELVDLKQTAESLVRDYRVNLSALLALALVLIALLLAVRLNLKQAGWLLLNVTAAVGVAAACSSWWQGGLSLFDIMALTLVAGLGLDYALFYGRARSRADDTATAKAVFLCAVSSLIVFGILALSSIPVLRGIGTSVFIGVIAAFVLARLGRQANTAV